MQLVARHAYPRPPLVRPDDNGYVLLAAELERPSPLRRSSASRRALLREVVVATGTIAQLEGVRRVDVFDALFVPPGAREGLAILAEHVPKTHRASFDLVVLIECGTVDGARALVGEPALSAIERLLPSDAPTLRVVARNVRRIGEVDKRRGGVFLFNYFFVAPRPEGDEVDAVLAVWEHTAGWFTTTTGLDNSTLLRPLDPCDYTVVNHCRWDGLLDIMPHLALRPSLRAFVGANFTANGIVAMPVLYRLAGSDGVASRRPWAGIATVALGMLHLLATVPPLSESLPRIAERGAWGGVSAKVPPPAEAMADLAVLFSLVVGVLLLVTGGLLARIERGRGRFPAWLGPTLLATGLVGGVLVPPSGFWLVAVLGIWLTARR